MGLGGMLAARGDMAMVPLVLWGTLGTTVGNYFWYAVGRHFGYQGLKPFVDRHGRWLTVEWDDVERLHRFFLKHGGKTVFVFRFLPTFRTMISLPAGMAKMPHWRFALATFTGSAIWNGVLAGAGYYLGRNFDRLDAYVGPAAVALTVAIVLGYCYRVLTWKPRAERP